MEIFNQLCGMNQVRIRLTVGNVPSPNTSHPVSWIRSHGGASGFTSNELIAFTTYHIGVQFPQPQRGDSAIVVVHINLTFPNMYIASELLPYGNAVQLVQTHEAGHPREWQDLMRTAMQGLVTNINSIIYTAATNRQAFFSRIQGIIRQEFNGWNVLLRQNSDNWDRSDYPTLHRNLRNLNVPVI